MSVNRKALLLAGLLVPLIIIGAIALKPSTPENNTPDDTTATPEPPTENPSTEPEEPSAEPIEEETTYHPRIASWLAKKDELITSQKPYSLVMAGWFSPEEAVHLRENNPDVQLLAGLSATWVWDNEGWMNFLLTVANYGRETPLEITEDMYLHDENGDRCGFGWASEEWQQEEIYAMDQRSPEWVELITSFYELALAQPQHDGIIIDMVVEKQYWCPTITDQEWLDATKAIYQTINDLNTEDKLIIFNAGATLADIDEYSQYFDGYLMENFLGTQLKTSFADGLEAVDSDKLVIYAVDTDDTGIIDMNRMRLGLTLSLLGDNTYFTYDFGPRDHGQAWWYPEYDVDLGEPLGDYYLKDGAYWRDFEKGFVIAAPYGATVSFDEEVTDVTSDETGTSFTIFPGDGRIYLSTSITN